MTKAKTPVKQKTPSKPKKPPITGQKRYKTTKEALTEVLRILGELHVQTHDKMKVR